jgi:hypothetical protein
MRSPSDSRAFFLVLPRRSPARPGVTEFSRWLQQQAKAEEIDTVLKDPVREERGTRRR